jgi:Hemagglutinin repeat
MVLREKIIWPLDLMSSGGLGFTVRSAEQDADGFAANGDIDARGTYISGKNVTLDAAHDINLQSAKDTTQLSSRHRSPQTMPQGRRTRLRS